MSSAARSARSQPVQRVWLPLLIGVLAALPAPSGAQDAAELARRVDVAVARRGAATTALAAHRLRTTVSAPRPLPFPDTVAILGGVIRLVTPREFLPLVQSAAAQADTFVRHRTGAEWARLAPTVFAVWSDSIRRAEGGVLVSRREDGRDTATTAVLANAPALAGVIEEHVQSAMAMARMPRLISWMGGGLPRAAATDDDWRAVRLELVSSPAIVSHRCFTGDLAACKATLGLAPATDPPTAWFDSAGRRAAVESVVKSSRLDASRARECLDGRDAVCTALLRESPVLQAWSAPPGSAHAKRALVQEAIAVRPGGSLARLATSADDPASVVSAIAAMPVDSVVARWQRRVREGGVRSRSATPVIALTAASWILIMGALSLGSPRWR